MKTAISIDDDLFEKAEKLSEKLHVSRSQLFSQAVEYLIEKNDTLEIIQKLNAIYKDENESNDGQDVVRAMKRKMKANLEKW